MERSFIPYPTGHFRRLARLPIYLHRLGLGNLVGAARILILTTRGRKSGKPRFTALEFRRHGSKIYVVSAWGERPQWYRNLLADPRATVQIGRQVVGARASVVENPAEAVRVLYMFRRTNPIVYDQILTRMSTADTIDLNTLGEVANQFTIVRLDTVPEAPPLPIVPVDWGWMMPVALAALALTVLFGLARSRRMD